MIKLRPAINRFLFSRFFKYPELNRLQFRRGKVLAIIIDSMRSSQQFNDFDRFQNRNFHLHYCSIDNNLYTKKYGNKSWCPVHQFGCRPHHYNLCIIEKEALTGKKFHVVKKFLDENNARTFQWNEGKCNPYVFD